MDNEPDPCALCAGAYLRGEDSCPCCGIPLAALRLRRARRFNRLDLFDIESEVFDHGSNLPDWDSPLLILIVLTALVVSSTAAHILF